MTLENVEFEAPNPDTVYTLCYTSGTTGMPKGVMLTHDNMTYYMQTALKDALKDYEEYPG